MIIGIGTDIIEIVRIKRAVQRWGRKFLDRIYTEDELSYCYLKKDPFACLAARFAAKEAAIKAFSWIFDSNHANKIKKLSLKDIEIINKNGGLPYLIIKNLNFRTKISDYSIHLTISHERVYAVATVVIEKSNSER